MLTPAHIAYMAIALAAAALLLMVFVAVVLLRVADAVRLIGEEIRNATRRPRSDPAPPPRPPPVLTEHFGHGSVRESPVPDEGRARRTMLPGWG